MRKSSVILANGAGGLLLLALLFLVVGCGPQSTFDTAGPVAELQKDLLIAVFVVAAFVFVAIEGLIIYFALRYRQRAQGDKLPKQTHGNPRLELLWTIVPALILIAITIPTVRAIWQLASVPDGALEVQAIGHRWWFEFRYPTKEIVTANELYVPVGTPVQVNLASQDVIHSFWVPRLAGKVDMVPTKDNMLYFQADEAGVYEGQCAEFCGEAHALMKFRVIALEPDDFEKWADDWFNPPSADTAFMPGAELFATNCSTCHTTNSYKRGGYASEIERQQSRSATLTTACPRGLTPECGKTVGIVAAPNLTHLGLRTTIGAGWKPLTRASLISWIENPASLKIGTYMQAFAKVYDTPDQHANLTPAEIELIADYLLALSPAPVSASSSTTEQSGEPQG